MSFSLDFTENNYIHSVLERKKLDLDSTLVKQVIAYPDPSTYLGATMMDSVQTTSTSMLVPVYWHKIDKSSCVIYYRIDAKPRTTR